ncbi:MAG TPA: OmpA family protein, partial [Thermoanaerobaculia bacterium]
AQWLRNHRTYHVMIEGHCDERGTEQYNLALGEKRAYDAKEYLSTLGIDTTRLSTISYGEDKPFDQGHDEIAWSKNRRAHVVLTSASK